MTVHTVDPSFIPESVRDVARTLAQNGERAWIVGGCLRDILLGRPVNDWDLATTARPERMTSLFRKTIPTGIKHGTVTVLHRGHPFEITTLRGEGAYSDGRRPDEVYYVDRIEDDLARRDFTVNAIAFDPLETALVDPFDGLGDLERRILRAVGSPIERFREDGLRILRGARFAATLEFTLDSATEAAFRPTLDVFARVSHERVRDEWMKAMKARCPSRAFEVMRRTGILGVIFPELAELDERRFAMGLAAVDAAPVGDPVVRHAALFAPLAWDGAEAAAAAGRRVDAFLRDYRYSNDERTTISHLVAVHDVQDEGSWDGPTLRQHLQRVGEGHVGRWLALLDVLAGPRGAVERYARLRKRTQVELDARMAFTVKDLGISGRDLQTELGLAAGPHLGRILRVLLERVTELPAQNERTRLLEIARDVARTEVP